MKRENIYLLVIVLVEILAIAIIIWIATHSEFVTHVEFLTGITAIFAAMSTGFWALWSRISQLAENIGYLKGKTNQKKMR